MRAREYIPPHTIPKGLEPITLDDARVRFAPEIDPRNQHTQLSIRVRKQRGRAWSGLAVGLLLGSLLGVWFWGRQMLSPQSSPARTSAAPAQPAPTRQAKHVNWRDLERRATEARQQGQDDSAAAETAPQPDGPKVTFATTAAQPVAAEPGRRAAKPPAKPTRPARSPTTKISADVAAAQPSTPSAASDDDATGARANEAPRQDSSEQPQQKVWIKATGREVWLK